MNAASAFVRQWMGCDESFVSKAFLWSEAFALACFVISIVMFLAGVFLRDMKQAVFAKAGKVLLDYAPLIFVGAAGGMLLCGSLFSPYGALVAVAVSLIQVGCKVQDLRVSANRLPHLSGWEANDAKKTIQDASRKMVRWSVSAVFFMAWFAVLVKLSSMSFWDLLAGD